MNATLAALGAIAALAAGMVAIPAGDYLPVRSMGAGVRMPVAAFALDAHAVTRGEFLAFVRTHPEWRRGATAPPRADAAYLANWRGPLDPGGATDLRRPVTSVSWYAATAYCEARHARLPTTDEWEYVAAASGTARDGSRDPVFRRRLLALYATRTSGPLPPVGSGFTNAFGIEGLHGSAWEWTSDFRPAPMTNCAGAALGASDPSNYPALLREAFRSALTERTTALTLGFRCAAGTAP